MRARQPWQDLGSSFSPPAPRSLFSLREAGAVEGPEESSLLLEVRRERDGGESGVDAHEGWRESEAELVNEGGERGIPGSAVSAYAAADE